MNAALTAQRRIYSRNRRAALRDGTWQASVPATAVRDHIDHLRARGMSVKAIAEASGLPYSTVAPIAWEGYVSARTWVHGATAAAILATTPDMAPGWALMPPTGTVRRLDALQWMGWPLSEIARRMGVTIQAVSKIRRQDRIQVSRAHRIARLYDELSMTPGPDKRAHGWALKRGAVGPLAWDDDTIDDPAARPQGAGYTPAPVIDTIRDLGDLGLTRDGIAARLGVTRGAIDRAIERAERNAA